MPARRRQVPFGQTGGDCRATCRNAFALEPGDDGVEGPTDWRMTGPLQGVLTEAACHIARVARSAAAGRGIILPEQARAATRGYIDGVPAAGSVGAQRSRYGRRTQPDASARLGQGRAIEPQRNGVAAESIQLIECSGGRGGHDSVRLKLFKLSLRTVYRRNCLACEF